MKLIIGLGNPGIRYGATRHNAGFMVVRQLALRHRIRLAKAPGARALVGKGAIDGCACVLALPLTFMNLSGEAVASLMAAYTIGPERLLLVYDEVDLLLGTLRIRGSGSSGGHRGVRSVIDAIGSKEFARLRVGIGRPADGGAVTDYVLSPFTRKEQPQVRDALARAADCCEAWCSQGIEKSMNLFNRRSLA